MYPDSKLTGTHISRLRRIHYALKDRQKMNGKATPLILSKKNQDIIDEANNHIALAMALLQNVR